MNATKEIRRIKAIRIEGKRIKGIRIEGIREEGRVGGRKERRKCWVIRDKAGSRGIK